MVAQAGAPRQAPERTGSAGCFRSQQQSWQSMDFASGAAEDCAGSSPTAGVNMSVAFTKELDSEAAAADLPDRPISPHPNLVTSEGLAQLDAALAEARAAYAAAQASEDIQADRTAMARATRDLRYYGARRSSAGRGWPWPWRCDRPGCLQRPERRHRPPVPQPRPRPAGPAPRMSPGSDEARSDGQAGPPRRPRCPAPW